MNRDYWEGMRDYRSFPPARAERMMSRAGEDGEGYPDNRKDTDEYLWPENIEKGAESENKS